MKNFRTYDLAVTFYHSSKNTKLPSYLKSQFLRASSSVVLNLREGSAKRSSLDRKRFYNISYASLKECQSILDLEPDTHLQNQADILAAHLFKLWKNCR